MARVDVSGYQTFGQITERLDDIVAQVRDKDVSLERSLDLFDEAIALGSKAVSLVDTTDFSPEEEARLVEGQGAPKEGESGSGADADAAGTTAAEGPTDAADAAGGADAADAAGASTESAEKPADDGR